MFTLHPYPSRKLSARSAFTLIELSIVLVVIGLIVAGVLTGRDMIRASEIRATLTQVEKFNTATNTFRGKYGYLPGDIPNPVAGQFGLTQRGNNRGQGDGNGCLEGVTSANNPASTRQAAGEPVMFWVDLSAQGLIEGGFNTASPTTIVSGSDITGTGISQYYPSAKIGGGNYFVVFGNEYYDGTNYNCTNINYFSLSSVSTIQASSNLGKILSTANIPVATAYAIDTKMDDGFPQSGNVTAWYIGGSNGNLFWTDGTQTISSATGPVPTTAATTGNSTTCYDNGHVTNATQTYSMEISNGANTNCALSFKFQ